jgi:hypothetical protein
VNTNFPTAVVSVAVPAGTYEVNFVADLETSDADGEAAVCESWVSPPGGTYENATAGGLRHDAGFSPTNLGSGPAGATPRYIGEDSGSDVYTLLDAGTISMACEYPQVGTSESSVDLHYDQEGGQFLSALPLGATN